MNISNLKIGMRLGAAFALILALMLVLAAIGLSSMSKIQDNLNQIVHGNVYKMALLQDMSESVHVGSRVMRTLIILTDEAEMGREYKKLENARSKYRAAFEALNKSATNEAGQALRDKIRAAAQSAQPINNQVIGLARDNQNSEATEVMMKQAGPATQALQDLIDEDVALQKKTNEKDAAAAHDAYATARLLMFVLAGVALVLGIVLAWLVTRSITGPIKEAVKVAQTVAAGDLNSRIEVTSQDETGQLLQALLEMNNSLRKIVAQVRVGADTIATASAQIASGNQDLSSRTEQQASSLEETASSMEELTSTVKQNGDSARQADQLAATASDVAVKGGLVVSQVVDTMGAINESARKIVDIIGVINGIAFQTNILALNAAVEAARAGEQGRGFAVVASEVRNLAQRSASAAKEIKSLIDDSVEKVDAGSKLVDQAGVTMNEIVASVKLVTDIMGEITHASLEQESGIEQISLAVSEMDAVTQQNAALVEEAAAAAESLQGQAANLAQVVSIFKLDGIETAPPRGKQQAIPLQASAKRLAKKPGAERGAAAPRPRIVANAPVGADQEWEEF